MQNINNLQWSYLVIFINFDKWTKYIVYMLLSSKNMFDNVATLLRI